VHIRELIVIWIENRYVIKKMVLKEGAKKGDSVRGRRGVVWGL
jgi:hypothetical protein